MASRTLKKILEHLTVPLPEDDGKSVYDPEHFPTSIEFPFNVEQFCREMDEERRSAIEMIDRLEGALIEYKSISGFNGPAVRALEQLASWRKEQGYENI